MPREKRPFIFWRMSTSSKVFREQTHSSGEKYQAPRSHHTGKAVVPGASDMTALGPISPRAAGVCGQPAGTIVSQTTHGRFWQ